MANRPAGSGLVTEAAGAAAFAPKAAAWAAGTAYAKDQLVIEPNTGTVVAARAAFTSGATYDATKWRGVGGTGVTGVGVLDSSLTLGGTGPTPQLGITGTVQTDIRQQYRNPMPQVPTDLSSILTPSVDPYGHSDGIMDAISFDNHYLLVGEDGQHHVIQRQEWRTWRADREPGASGWAGGYATPWTAPMTTKVAGYQTSIDSPNAFMRTSAAERWTYTDAAINKTVNTGYAISVGSGDRITSGPNVYRPPFVTFWRDGAQAAQSLTAMLDQAGIMGGSYSTPRCLQQVMRSAADTFFLCGHGQNQSTNPDNSRPTFGQMTLTLDAAKSQTGPTAVTAVSWTDYLPTLQAVMPAGETIVNVPAMADALLSGVLLVLVVTLDGSSAYRVRLVNFTVAGGSAALDTLNGKLSGTPSFPGTPATPVSNQAVAAIAVGPNGVLVTYGGSASAIALYRGTSETTWRNVFNQAMAGFGINTTVYSAIYDPLRSRFVVVGGGQAGAYAGWLDANCKQGHPLTNALPLPTRTPGDNVRGARGVCTDSLGTLVVGARQLTVFVPQQTLEAAATRVLWGCRVIPTGANDQVQVTEGEVVIYQSTGKPKRVYVPAQTVAIATTATVTIVATATGVAQRPGNGFASGVDYPDPVLQNQCILATVTDAATGGVLLAGEIDQVTFRDQ